jgi:hypothetical protein
VHIYQNREVTVTRKVCIRTVCDKCRRTFNSFKLDKRHCHTVTAEITVRTDWHYIEDFWQNEEELHLCADCYNRLRAWLNKKPRRVRIER